MSRILYEKPEQPYTGDIWVDKEYGQAFIWNGFAWIMTPYDTSFDRIRTELIQLICRWRSLNEDTHRIPILDVKKLLEKYDDK